MRFRLLAKPGGGRWAKLAEATLDSSAALALPAAAVAEGDDIRIVFADPPEPPPALRVLVGSVPVASTLPTDRVAPIEFDDTADGEDQLFARGRFFADWVGATDLAVVVRVGDAGEWKRAVSLPVAVSAGKITAEQFERLFAELERESSAVLLDIYGKSRVGLAAAGPVAPSAPVAVLHRVGEAVQELDGILHRIRRQPACRLKTTRLRELATAGQAVSEATLQEACADPRMLARRGGRPAVREHLREQSRADYRLPEHQAVSDFAEYLKAQLADLRTRIDSEMAERQERRGWRSASKGDGGATWWEREDLPRIEELALCRDTLGLIRRRIEAWAAFEFLPPGTRLREHPALTPLFRVHPLYRRAYRVMASHFLAFRATLDPQPLLARARSLPVLYEWWCTLRVLRFLARTLTPAEAGPSQRPPFRHTLADGRRTFTVEFAADQEMTFEDGRGGRVRFRYTPEYGTGDRGIGLLDGGSIRTPDITLELHPAAAPDRARPALIVVLDAKYSGLPQRLKAEEVRAKYSAIGDLADGTVLSRQVWALTPMPSDAPKTGVLRGHCTTDNSAFWGDSFNMANPVTGAVEVRPVAADAFDPLAELLTLLLRRSGIELAKAS